MTGVHIWGVRRFALATAIIERLKALKLWAMVNAMLYGRGGCPEMMSASVDDDGVMKLIFKLGDGSGLTVRATNDGNLRTEEVPHYV